MHSNTGQTDLAGFQSFIRTLVGDDLLEHVDLSTFSIFCQKPGQSAILEAEFPVTNAPPIDRCHLTVTFNRKSTTEATSVLTIETAKRSGERDDMIRLYLHGNAATGWRTVSVSYNRRRATDDPEQIRQRIAHLNGIKKYCDLVNEKPDITIKPDAPKALAPNPSGP
ncbi:MAG: hypothetical protein U9N14_01260 [Pseudomonadota bacterium]|nr:hypothetical protein [Pseudomonadota bacterium]